MAINTPRGNAIRIVPLFVPGVGVPATANLTYRGGTLLSNAQVFTAFWGTAWQQSPQSNSIQQLTGLFDYILTSSLIEQLAEYSTPTQTIGHGSRIATATVTTSDPGQSVTDAAIQNMLQNEIANNAAFPQPTSNTLYFVYLPPGVVVVQGGRSSCQSFCGYHDAINGQIFYGVMPSPDCAGCIGGLAAFDALTSTSSHELCEAITDPVPGQGWYDDTNGEIGDICAWRTKQVGNYTVQQEWSNKAGSCI